MIQFLNPSILLALAAAAIPLIIHLLSRRNIKRVPFSTIQFLKRLERKQMRTFRLRQWLLLLLRTLIIMSLVLAFARPTLKSGHGGFFRDRSPIAAVILLDNSLSLNEVYLTGSLLKELRQRFVELKTVFREGDRISLIQTTRPEVILARDEPFSEELWDRVLKRIQPNYLKSDMVPAIQRAVAWLKTSPFANKEMYLLSDMQRTAFPDNLSEAVDLAEDAGIRLIVLPIVHRPSENLALDSVAVVTQLVERNQPIRIQAYVSNPGSEKHLTSLVSVVLNGKRVAQTKVTVAPGGREGTSFRLTLSETGFVQGYVELESDALLEDNRRFFHFYVPAAINVLHIVGSDTLPSFVPWILKPALDKQVFAYQRETFSRWSSVNFLDFDFIVVEGVQNFPETFLSRLTGFVNRGGGLLLIPSASASLRHLQAAFARFTIGRVVEPWGTPGSQENFLTLRRLRWQHPIFEGLFEKTPPRLNPIEVYAGLRVLPSPKALVLIRAGDRIPFLILKPVRRGLVYVLTTPLQQSYTLLPFKGLVIPLFYRMIYYSALYRHGPARTLLCGQPFQAAFAHLSAPFNFSVVDPAGNPVQLNTVVKGDQVVLQFQDTFLPGNYRVYHNNNVLTLFSVNVDPGESYFTPLEESELAKLFPAPLVLSSETPIAQQIHYLRFGKELWKYGLLLALVLLFLEMIIARTAGKETPVPELVETGHPG